MTELIVDILRGVVIAVGWLVIGMAVRLLATYSEKATEFGWRTAVGGLALWATAFMLLVFATMGTQIEFLVDNQHQITWRLFVVAPAYILGLLGMRALLRERYAAHPHRRRTDP